MLKYLLDEGCNPNLVDMYGQSPLHIAALSGNLSAIRLLYQGESAILSILVNSFTAIINYSPAVSSTVFTKCTLKV